MSSNHKSKMVQLRPINVAVYFTVHAGFILLAMAIPATGEAIAMAVVLYFVRMFGITGGYHRYFSHRSFKTSREFQFVLALLGTLAAQKGVLWWAAEHRHHHRHSDKPSDHHSPVHHGFLWSHVGWFLSKEQSEDELHVVRDLAHFPELRWINRFHLVGPVGLAVLCWVLQGPAGVAWGFGISTIACWHATYCINSLTHLFGTRRYATSDNSRNSLILALLTMGEGWHNNHHRYPSIARQGLFAWEIDLTYYVLRFLSLLGLVWDLRGVPASAYREQANKEVHQHQHRSRFISAEITVMPKNSEIRTPKSICRIDESGALYVVFMENARLSLSDAHEVTIASALLVNASPGAAIVDFRLASRIDWSAMCYFFRDPTHVATYQAVAILTNTKLGALLGSTAACLMHPIRPRRFFTSEKVARKWLRAVLEDVKYDTTDANSGDH